MDDPNDGPWGVYENVCRDCGKKLVIVATVASFDEGYAEAYIDGQPRCSACDQAVKDRLAQLRSDGPPPITEDHL